MTDLYEIRFGGVLFHATDNPDDHHTMTQRLHDNGHQPDQEGNQ